MLVLNYAHPFTDKQSAQLAAHLQLEPEVRVVAVQTDRTRPLSATAQELADATGLSSAEWQTRPLLINPPGVAPLALALLAEIHGRCGFFPNDARYSFCGQCCHTPVRDR